MFIDSLEKSPCYFYEVKGGNKNEISGQYVQKELMFKRTMMIGRRNFMTTIVIKLMNTN
jgi:hypothetical protein